MGVVGVGINIEVAEGERKSRTSTKKMEGQTYPT